LPAVRLHAFLAALVVLLTAPGAPAAGDVRILSAVGMRQVLLELGPRFESVSGHRVVTTFESSGLIPERLEGADLADIVLINEAGLAQLRRAGRIEERSATAIATSRVGVAVRSGAAKPDISTADAFKRTLLAARMVACPDPALGGSSGLHLASVMERLGIAATMTPRTIYADPPGPNASTPGSLVASGRADLALHQMQELIAVAGIEIAGPLPNELQQTFTFSAAIARGATDVAVAKTFIAFLQTPPARAVILAKGMDVPGR
jgi:molybdate transport system substrate-binding protein